MAQRRLARFPLIHLRNVRHTNLCIVIITLNKYSTNEKKIVFSPSSDDAARDDAYYSSTDCMGGDF